MNNKKIFFDRERFARALIKWFLEEKRDLPWRENQDPYRVWVSEVMLQQTKVNTTIPYYHNFMEKFPSLSHLAQAEEDEVLKAWEGLGYYSRVRNLHSAVKEVEEKYGGEVPNTKKELASLKGVGPYTTGAILSIAYGIPEPAVDGNVMRVMSRVLSIWEDIAKSKTRKIFEEAVADIIPAEDPSSFNQGLMELGALICTPTSPSCMLCPVMEYCQSFHEGTQRELPVKSKKAPPKYQPMIAGVFTVGDGKYFIHKRSKEGLLANLWEFPNMEFQEKAGSKEEQLEKYMKNIYGADVEIGGYLTNIQHVFTHLIWDIDVFIGTAKGDSTNLIPVTTEEMDKFAFPVSHQKIIRALADHSSKE